MGNLTSKKDKQLNELRDMVDAGREAEACAILWKKVVDEDQYTQLRSLDLQIENLVFEGGGTKGVAYCGAVKVLHDLRILKNVKRFAGTSAGSFVAMKLCLSLEVDDILINSLDNIQTAIEDANKFGFVYNVLRKFGWHNGHNLLQYIRKEVTAATGNPDTTFYEWYKKSKGRELCVVVTNVTTGSVEYCHPKTTPDMTIAEAVRASMSIPIMFQPYHNGQAQNIQYFCDGGLVNNYPIEAFDGWYLSMEKENSFFHKLDQIYTPFQGESNKKTLGLVLFTAMETELFQEVYIKRYGENPQGSRPNTALAQSRIKKIDEISMKKLQRNELVESSKKLLEELGRCDKDLSGDINLNEFKMAFVNMSKDPEMQAHLTKIFGKAELDLEEIFQQADTDNNNSLSFSECLHMLQKHGAPLRQVIQTSIPGDINTMTDYLTSVFSAMDTRVRSLAVRPDDVKRTIGIYTDYVGSTDFDMSLDDKIYAMKQGWRATIAYLTEVAATQEMTETDHITLEMSENTDM